LFPKKNVDARITKLSNLCLFIQPPPRREASSEFAPGAVAPNSTATKTMPEKSTITPVISYISQDKDAVSLCVYVNYPYIFLQKNLSSAMGLTAEQARKIAKALLNAADQLEPRLSFAGCN
jgi:hypothetical protein